VVEENLCREAAQRGIARHRLVFAARVGYDEHMSRYANADLFLDSLPFNGGATASDALTLGIPILTCAGESFAARMSASLLENLGVPELITYSLPDYETKAVQLARAPEQLARLRRALAERRRGHAFFDTDRYRRHLESAFRTMWSRNERGLAPAAFAVESSDGAQRSV